MTTRAEFLKTVEEWAKFYFYQSLTDFFNYQRHSDLSLLQAYALTHLYYKGPIKVSELCEHMKVSPAAGSQMIDRLEKLDMVERIADPKDRRVRKIIVLEKGKGFVQEQFVGSQSWISEIPANMTSEQEAQITEILSSLITSSGMNNLPYMRE